ncbi:J domain-containing protein required for chloroplast accumulation response 1 [Quillaja saponaria]|uniref:J domain-containing protein required for chloroplast accumulation response 1 n=1 Tax=Quillaja saponaria TaxID=32244 RepID=A0AAD7LYP4_QUISA|nr:J domain-containing protein required for chloroplast accumulation response 1 [Quillaja saponaria]
MDRFSERESVLLGCSPQRSPMNPSCSTKILQRKSAVDFHDVFGGPPRRSSIHEIQHSFSELPESIEMQKEDEALSCPWPAFKEKPVFGEENVNRRRSTSDDFFDDIFRGDDSSSPTTEEV